MFEQLSGNSAGPLRGNQTLSDVGSNVTLPETRVQTSLALDLSPLSISPRALVESSFSSLMQVFGVVVIVMFHHHRLSSTDRAFVYRLAKDIGNTRRALLILLLLSPPLSGALPSEARSRFPLRANRYDINSARNVAPATIGDGKSQACSGTSSSVGRNDARVPPMRDTLASVHTPRD